MKKIKSISLVLENSEMICLKRSEFRDLDIQEISQDVFQVGKEMFELDSFDYASFTLNAVANHTYNSFGEVSEKTIFDRLTSSIQPAAVLMLQYDNNTYRDLFISNDMAQVFEPNEYGDLFVEFFKPDAPVNLDEEDDLDC